MARDVGGRISPPRFTAQRQQAAGESGETGGPVPVPGCLVPGAHAVPATWRAPGAERGLTETKEGRLPTPEGGLLACSLCFTPGYAGLRRVRNVLLPADVVLPLLVPARGQPSSSLITCARPPGRPVIIHRVRALVPRLV